MTFINTAIFEDGNSSTALRLDVKKVTTTSDEYKLYLFSPEVLIPLGKSDRLNDDLTMEHSKHFLEEHGSTFPGSPKAHSREKRSHLKRATELTSLFLRTAGYLFVLHVTRSLGLKL